MERTDYDRSGVGVTLHLEKKSIDFINPNFLNRKDHMSDVASVQTKPLEPLCGSQPEKDLGLKPDTNEHMSGFRILLPFQLPGGCWHYCTCSLTSEPARATLVAVGAGSWFFTASSLPECIQPGMALLASPGCEWSSCRDETLTGGPVTGQFRTEWEETLNFMGLGEQSLFIEMPEAMTLKYHKESSRKQP